MLFFLDNGYISKNKEFKSFKNGQIESPYEKRVFGIGYLGEGKYSPVKDGKRTKHHRAWKGILERCYDEKLAKNRPTYKGCMVCEEWHNFQNFAKWYDENYYEIEGEKMCLDKDILIKGNKIYSPETCVFVPNRINVLFTKSDAKKGKYPIGVCKIFNTTDKIYQSYCSIFKNNKKMSVGLGCFNSVEKAFSSYKEYKEKYIKQVADEYRYKIPQILYDAMYRYEVEITD